MITDLNLKQSNIKIIKHEQIKFFHAIQAETEESFSTILT